MDAGQHESRFENTARRGNDYEADRWSLPRFREEKKKPRSFCLRYSQGRLNKSLFANIINDREFKIYCSSGCLVLDDFWNVASYDCFIYANY